MNVMMKDLSKLQKYQTKVTEAIEQLEALPEDATWQLRNKWKAEKQYWTGRMFLIHKKYLPVHRPY